MKAKPTPSQPMPLPMADALEAIRAASAVSALNMPMDQLTRIQGDYLKNATDFWNHSMHRLQGDAANPAAKPTPLGDRRFSSSEWLSNPASAMTAELYLLNARTMLEMADSMQGDAKTKARVRFAVQQWVDMTSPSNFLALNPEALKKAIDTHGQSITTGMQHLLQDVQKGHVSQTDESVFEVG